MFQSSEATVSRANYIVMPAVVQWLAIGHASLGSRVRVPISAEWPNIIQIVAIHCPQTGFEMLYALETVAAITSLALNII